MKDKPIIFITEPEIQHIENGLITTNIFDYDNSHIIYKGVDLGTFKQICKLRKDNQELKKQLEEKEKIACNWKDSCLENAGKIEKLENQQKEFIEYLTCYIDALKNQEESIEGLDIGEEHILMTLEEILDKYKEIIGVSNDSKK